jgi:hypothetical protein
VPVRVVVYIGSHKLTRLSTRFADQRHRFFVSLTSETVCLLLGSKKNLAWVFM